MSLHSHNPQNKASKIYLLFLNTVGMLLVVQELDAIFVCALSVSSCKKLGAANVEDGFSSSHSVRRNPSFYYCSRILDFNFFFCCRANCPLQLSFQ